MPRAAGVKPSELRSHLAAEAAKVLATSMYRTRILIVVSATMSTVTGSRRKTSNSTMTRDTTIKKSQRRARVQAMANEFIK